MPHQTAYQKGILAQIREFCVDKKFRGKKFAELPAPEREARLLPPWLTYVRADDGAVVAAWPTHSLGGGRRIDYRLPETRHENAAFGVFLDWCDDRGLWYGEVLSASLPGAKYRPGLGFGSAKVFAVVIPKEPR